MKTLSIRQPWASMIVLGLKPVENRSWKSNFRGRIKIHAGKKFDQEGATWIIETFPDLQEHVLAA
ncbi:MAG: ASCH domain-containing protein, partial [Longimonas sp.]|uniref:ASCH domain-containing protein n=1 Tax=Longimonas sp. TaxID=2039626 RepID=UPI0039765CFB